VALESAYLICYLYLVLSKTSVMLNQVVLKQWENDRMRAAIEKRQRREHNLNRSDWVREAIKEKCDRELGPAPPGGR